MTSPLTSTGKRKHLTVTEIEAYMKRRCFLIVSNARGEGDILKVEVNITDYAFVFGNHRFLISPKAGTGKAWRNITQLEFE